MERKFVLVIFRKADCVADSAQTPPPGGMEEK